MAQELQIVNDTVKMIQETTELFYQQKQEAAFQKMGNVLTQILAAVDTLHQYAEQKEDFSFDEARVASSLTEAMEAMEAGDTVLLADILQYDFAEYLQEVAEAIV